jgi:hypothetical protein
MKRLLSVLTLLTAFSISLYAQKPTTTKPSVKELLSAATSSNPLGDFSTLAKKNGYRGIETATDYGIKTTYVKNVGSSGKRVELTISLLDINTFEYIIATSFTPAVFKAWESQIKALGFYFDKHDTQVAFRGSTQEYWHYTKPGYPPISISQNSYNKEYMLIIGNSY